MKRIYEVSAGTSPNNPTQTWFVVAESVSEAAEKSASKSDTIMLQQGSRIIRVRERGDLLQS